MSTTVRGFSFRAVDTGHGRGDPGKTAVNFGKVLPATTTAPLFTVTGVINATLIGVVSTVGGVAATHLSIGVTGNNVALAANGAATFTTVAVGSVFQMPSALGGALPAPVVASSNGVASVADFVVANTAITLTTDATNAAAITWILSFIPLFPKGGGASVVAN